MHTSHAQAPQRTVMPASAAAALVRSYGPTRALRTAEAEKRGHPEYSPMAAFWDETARLIEQGIVEARNAQARQHAHDAGSLATYRLAAALRGVRP